jgi:hypothetical protein
MFDYFLSIGHIGPVCLDKATDEATDMMEGVNSSDIHGPFCHSRMERGRPSQYLRAKCPLCFGGMKCHDPASM